MAFRKHLRRIDSKIQICLDKILPRSLTLRYIIGLAVVAILAVSGQLLIRSSVTDQLSFQKIIRVLDRQVPLLSNLERLMVSIEVSQSKIEINHHVESVRGALSKLTADRDALHGYYTENGIAGNFPVISSRIDYIIKFNEKLILLVNQAIQFGKLKEEGNQIDVPDETLEWITLYEIEVTNVVKLLETELGRQTLQFQHTELTLLLITLFILVLEALYVFRPSVESLNAALKIRSDFLSRIGHEVRNPMNAILGMTNLISETTLSDLQRNYVNILKRSASGLLEVLNNLLDFSRIEWGNIKLDKVPFNLYQVLERVIDLSVYGAQANGTELMLELSPDVSLQRIGDPTKLQQVLSNLVGNAVKFTRNGEVVLKVETVTVAGRDEVRFTVTDTGIGIEEDNIDKIFDPFVQADSFVRRKFGGSGLGLSISKELVEKMDGKLKVESKKNVGSKFFFNVFLPQMFISSFEDDWKQYNIPSFKAVILFKNAKLRDYLGSLFGNHTESVFLKDANELEKYFYVKESSPTLYFLDYEFVSIFLSEKYTPEWRFKLNFDRLIFFLPTGISTTEIERLSGYGFRHFLFKPIRPFLLLDSILSALSLRVVMKEKRANLPVDNRALKILVAEDSKDNQLLIKEYFQFTPYVTTFTENGKEALDAFMANPFDILLMDIQMPEMDGHTAVRMIRNFERINERQPVPIVALSAHVGSEEQVRFSRSGFTAFLGKPINHIELRKLILDLTTKDGINKDAPEAVESEDTIALKIEARLKKLAPNYLKNRDEELKVLKSSLESGDLSKIETIGHRLKGNAQSYGFPELGLLGDQLEVAAKTADKATIQQQIVKIEKFLSSVSRI